MLCHSISAIDHASLDGAVQQEETITSHSRRLNLSSKNRSFLTNTGQCQIPKYSDQRYTLFFQKLTLNESHYIKSCLDY